MAYKPRVATVPEGGTGASTFTAYAPILAGTTSTGALQSAASAGTSGQVFLSNGAGVNPSFQTPSSGGGGYIFIMQTGTGSPADAVRYYMKVGNTFTNLTSPNNTSRYYIPVNGTLTALYGAMMVAGTLGSGESGTLGVRLNDTTDNTLSSSIVFSSAANTISLTGLSVALVAGDFIDFYVVCPTWATNPTTVSLTFTALIT